MSSNFFFTSESVTEGHPDKVSDQISDAVLDGIYETDPLGRVACETLVTTGLIFLAGEITTTAYVDIPKIARETIRRIGYTRAKYGFDYETCSGTYFLRGALEGHVLGDFGEGNGYGAGFFGGTVGAGVMW